MITKFKAETNWGTSFLSLETFASQTVARLYRDDGTWTFKTVHNASYFDTLDEAEAHLIREQRLKIESANDAIQKAKNRIEVIRTARADFEKMLNS